MVRMTRARFHVYWGESEAAKEDFASVAAEPWGLDKDDLLDAYFELTNIYAKTGGSRPSHRSGVEVHRTGREQQACAGDACNAGRGLL
jgi:hypothetical protein